MFTPDDPPIYHITHVDNLAGILAEGGICSDMQRRARELNSTNIGLKHIKDRRLVSEIKTQEGVSLGFVGQYVPFNFCPRSVMLFTIACGHNDYKGGQEEIIHLVSRVSAATSLKKRWTFTDRHAELQHALFYDKLTELHEVPWHVMDERYWQDVKEERQAEFLVHEFFSWSAVIEIAVMTSAVEQKVLQTLATAKHAPTVAIRPEWYY